MSVCVQLFSQDEIDGHLKVSPATQGHLWSAFVARHAKTSCCKIVAKLKNNSKFKCALSTFVVGNEKHKCGRKARKVDSLKPHVAECVKYLENDQHQTVDGILPACASPAAGRATAGGRYGRSFEDTSTGEWAR